MAAQHILVIFDRINSMVASAPYAYTRAKEPFSFDLQPDQALDLAYCITVEHGSTEGYLGPYQAEIERIKIRLARKTRRDAHGVHRQLLTDVNSLVSTVSLDGSAQDYNAELVGWRVPEPVGREQFVIGEIEFTVDYDRAL